LIKSGLDFSGIIKIIYKKLRKDYVKIISCTGVPNMASFRKGNMQYPSTFYSLSFLFDPVTRRKRKTQNRKFSKQKNVHFKNVKEEMVFK